MNVIPYFSYILTNMGEIRGGKCLHDGANDFCSFVKIQMGRHNWNYICTCTVKLYDILEIRNAMTKFIHYVTAYTIYILCDN